MRRLIIGDIHGGLRALIQVLERCDYDNKTDKVCFLGDYVDGWSESFEVIEYLINFKKNSRFEPVFIRGNHDIWLYNWLDFGHLNSVWINNGGKGTIDSYLINGYKSAALATSHLNFFKSMVDYNITLEGEMLVHGGYNYLIKSLEGLSKPYKKWAGLGAKECHWNRSLFDLYMFNGPEFKGVNTFNHIYIGHTSTTCWDIKPHYPEYVNMSQNKNGPITVPITRHNLTNMDTGAGYKGKLSIMDLKSREVWQSDLVSSLYPGEKENNK